MNQSMNNFSMKSGESMGVLSQSIMLYTKEKPKNQHDGQQEVMYATVHDVKNFGTEARPDFKVAAGVPVTQEALVGMFKALVHKHTLNVDFLPEHVLSISADHIVWWRPAGERNVFFNNKELGKLGKSVPHPALVFVVVQRHWFVYALATNERPKLDTVLCHAPYFNVYDSGGICTGSAAVPKGISANSTSAWEAAFFDSEFTHINGSKKKASHPRGEYALWKELLDGQYKTFPVEYLVAQTTVEQLMKGVRSQLGASA